MILELISIIHGLLGTLFLMAFSGVLVSLFSFNKNRYNLLRVSVLVMTITVILIDIAGIYLYGVYRAPNPESARSNLLASETPWVHTILMEFKEFAGIYVALLMILISFLVIHYKSEILEDRTLRNSVLFLLIVTMLLSLLTFGLGAYITKVRSI